MDDETRKARKAIENAKYRNSEKGKAARARYFSSEKAKATKKAYETSAAGKASKAKYDAKESVVARKKAYEASDKAKARRKAYDSSESRRTASMRAREKFPERNAARTAVARALKLKQLTRLPCFICGNANTQGHHPDYAAPLDVVWLCKKHHDEIHR